ncbi:hypothetical protein O181_054045 [Austropuccinia psidii MF-1]|uniref:Secreted protein n=1 Tax=Austropuccinia psidii MF-1 TaxID=1389203 RepID=A0A9Q3HU11_9BASI|nr:hypothetical protein [Austropuccinia psidii MF-1]
MLKNLYLALLCCSFFLSVTSVYVTCDEQYDDSLYNHPKDIYCRDTKSKFQCPRDRCGIGIENKPLNSSFYMTGCSRWKPPFTTYPYVWPIYIFHNLPGKLAVWGSVSSTLGGTRTEVKGYLNCTINGNVKPPINVVRPACHGCTLWSP